VCCLASPVGVVLLEFTDRRALEREMLDIRELHGAAVTPGVNRHTARARAELGEYFAGERTSFDVPLDLRGSPFQLAVWERLRQIGHGAVASYGQIARDVGRAGAARAVGRANGENRIAIIVPCHRVIQADGSLCGYGGGVWRKRWLLEHEARLAPAGAQSHGLFAAELR
jgi:AraC family transcriptional regulator of adaptative response/methylated-DNA-[protein]-cysteine methyltransferase